MSRTTSPPQARPLADLDPGHSRAQQSPVVDPLSPDASPDDFHSAIPAAGGSAPIPAALDALAGTPRTRQAEGFNTLVPVPSSQLPPQSRAAPTHGNSLANALRPPSDPSLPFPPLRTSLSHGSEASQYRQRPTDMPHPRHAFHQGAASVPSSGSAPTPAPAPNGPNATPALPDTFAHLSFNEPHVLPLPPGSLPPLSEPGDFTEPGVSEPLQGGTAPDGDGDGDDRAQDDEEEGVDGCSAKARGVLDQYLQSVQARLKAEVTDYQQPRCYREGSWWVRPPDPYFVKVVNRAPGDAASISLQPDLFYARPVFVWLPETLTEMSAIACPSCKAKGELRTKGERYQHVKYFCSPLC